uniref:CSTF2_hinge domain-containing protein n=1 Tax=Globodera pallida TaxID=36090 RepID=A0A183C1N0_GLOPA
MHHSQIFEGCSKPVVVKFADSGREKGVKRFSDVKSAEGSKPNSGGPTNNNQGITQLTTTGVETLTSLVTLLQQPNIIPLLETARVLQQLQSAQTVTSPANLMLKTDQNHQQNAFKLPTLLQTNLHAMQQGGLLGLSPGMFFQQPVVGAPSLSPAALTLSLPKKKNNNK